MINKFDFPAENIFKIFSIAVRHKKFLNYGKIWLVLNIFVIIIKKIKLKFLSN